MSDIVEFHDAELSMEYENLVHYKRVSEVLIVYWKKHTVIGKITIMEEIKDTEHVRWYWEFLIQAFKPCR